MNIAGSEIHTSTNARDLGVTLDRCLTMSTHVSNVWKSVSYALIGNIRQYLDQLGTEKLIHAFAKLDYCNSLLYGLPDKRSSNSNVFRTQPPDLSQKLGKWNTSHQFSVTGYLCINVSSLRFFFLPTRF